MSNTIDEFIMCGKKFNRETFSEIDQSLRGLPQTWYPALVITVLEEALKSGAFKADAIPNFIQQAAIRATAIYGSEPQQKGR